MINVFKCFQSFNTSYNIFQRFFIWFTSVIISFSRFNQVIWSFHCSNSLIQSLQEMITIFTDIETSQKLKDIKNIIILNHYNVKNDQTRVNTSLKSLENIKIHFSKLSIFFFIAEVELFFETLCFHAQRQFKYHFIY